MASRGNRTMKQLAEAFERRAHGRVQRRLPCKLQIDGHRHLGIVRDFSASGFFVESTAPLPLGAAIVVALAISIALRSGLRSAAWTTAPAVLVASIWSLWASRAARDIPADLADLLGPYGGWLLDQTIAAPMAFLSGLPSHTLGVMARIASLLARRRARLVPAW